MSDWPTTERLNDPHLLRLTVEEELPTDDTIDDSDDTADEAVVGRDEEEQSSRPGGVAFREVDGLSSERRSHASGKRSIGRREVFGISSCGKEDRFFPYLVSITSRCRSRLFVRLASRYHRRPMRKTARPVRRRRGTPASHRATLDSRPPRGSAPDATGRSDHAWSARTHPRRAAARPRGPSSATRGAASRHPDLRTRRLRRARDAGDTEPVGRRLRPRPVARQSARHGRAVRRRTLRRVARGARRVRRSDSRSNRRGNGPRPGRGCPRAARAGLRRRVDIAGHVGGRRGVRRGLLAGHRNQLRESAGTGSSRSNPNRGTPSSPCCSPSTQSSRTPLPL